MSKFCHGCQTEKDESEFNKNRSKSDGLSSRCRQCNSAWGKRRQIEHPEKERVRHQAWLRSRPGYSREQNRKYRAAHPGYANDAAKKYRQRNPDKANESRKRWVANNRAHVNLRSSKRHALKVSHGESYTPGEWTALCERFGNRCLACGSAEPLTADHVVPVQQGGKNTIDNIQPLCQPCNSKKGTRVIDYRPQDGDNA